MKNAKSIDLWDELDADEERWQMEDEAAKELALAGDRAQATGEGLESALGDAEDARHALGDPPSPDELGGFLGHCYECGETVLDGQEAIVDHGISRETGYADVTLLCRECAEARGMRS